MPWGRRRVIAKRDDVKTTTRKNICVPKNTPKEPKKSKKGERKMKMMQLRTDDDETNFLIHSQHQHRLRNRRQVQLPAEYQISKRRAHNDHFSIGFSIKVTSPRVECATDRQLVEVRLRVAPDLKPMHPLRLPMHALVL